MLAIPTVVLAIIVLWLLPLVASELAEDAEARAAEQRHQTRGR
jgi:hypothetical protein